ncbi:MAG: hypothetical protein IPF52_12855 [Saprospiraceae bacterium]|nr:hypothetical protein [Saprospiraceae bacterium]
MIINPDPIASISGDDNICVGGSATFTADGGVSYIWSSGQNTQSITVSNTITRVVTVTDANGCKATAEKTLIIYSNPTASISGNNSVCNGGSVTFTASGGVNYEWSSTETIPTISVSDDVTRIVTVTDANGCTDTAEKTLIIHSDPIASISGSDEICTGVVPHLLPVEE